MFQTFRRLNAIGLSVSRATVLKLIDRISSEFDKPVLQWKMRLEQQSTNMTTEEHVVTKDSGFYDQGTLIISDSITDCAQPAHSTPIKVGPNSSEMLEMYCGGELEVISELDCGIHPSDETQVTTPLHQDQEQVCYVDGHISKSFITCIIESDKLKRNFCDSG